MSDHKGAGGSPQREARLRPPLLPAQILHLTPDQTRQISDPLERQRVALAHLEDAREEWKRQAGRWSAVRAEAVLKLKQGRTWAEVAELLGVSEPTAWNIAHPRH